MIFRAGLLGIVGFGFANLVSAATLLNYEFNGDLTDSSGNNNDGVVVAGAVTYDSGVDGQAAVFNGATVVAMPNDIIRGNPDFTLSFRFKTGASNVPIVGYQNQAFTQPNSASEYIPIVGINGNGTLRVTLWDGSSAFSVASTSVVNDNAWHRVDVVADTTNGTLEAFLDGSSIGQAASVVNHLSMQFNYLGGVRSTSYFATDFYTGALDLLTLSDDAQIPPPPVVAPAQPVPALPLGGLLGLMTMLSWVVYRNRRKKSD